MLFLNWLARLYEKLNLSRWEFIWRYRFLVHSMGILCLVPRLLKSFSRKKIRWRCSRPPRYFWCLCCLGLGSK